MAIVKAPALSLAASGNLGGINYTTWRGRAVARAAWSPTIPNTGLQIVIQSYLSSAVVNWRTVLTEADRKEWREYAKTQTTIDRLGEKRIPNGYNLFISRQIQALRSGGPISLLPPGPVTNVMVTRLFSDEGSTPGRVRWRFTGYQTPERPDRTEYWIAGPYLSEARFATENEWRFDEFRSDTGFAQFSGVPSNWYWCRGRMYDFSGIVGNWWEVHQLSHA